MWLLDVNIDRNVLEFLSRNGIVSDTARNRGWQTLANGSLVAEAAAKGFQCLLTRDRKFGEAAAKALRIRPGFSVVLITLPQAKKSEYMVQFSEAWDHANIQPQPGHFISFP